MLEGLLDMLSGDRSAGRIRDARIERKLDLIMEALEISLPEHPRATEVQAELDAGRPIAAIRLIRTISGAGLAESKAAVDDGTWRDLISAAS